MGWGGRITADKPDRFFNACWSSVAQVVVLVQRPRKTQESGIRRGYVGIYIGILPQQRRIKWEWNREWDCLVVYEG